MPVDPQIGLAAKAPDVFGMLGQFAQTQNALVQNQLLRTQNQLTQQTLAAKQAMGPLFQQSINPSTGQIDYNKFLSLAAKDPNAAILVPEMANTIAQRELTQVDMGGKIQTQSTELVNGFMADVAAASKDPSQLGRLLNTRLAGASPQVRAAVQGPLTNYVGALVADLPGAPGSAEQIAEYAARARTAAIEAKLPRDSMEYLFGRPGVQETPTGYVPFKQDPFTGAVAQTGPVLPKALGPQVVTGPGQVPIPVGGSSNPLTAWAPPGAGPTPSPTGLGQAPAPPAEAPAGATAGGPVGPASAPASGTAGNAGDGKPLFSGAMVGPSSGEKGVAGLPIMSAAQQEAAKEMAQEFAGPGAKEFNMSAASMASLRYMENALDKLNKGGGFLVPGAGAEFRTDVAKTMNTLAQMAGQWDPSKPIGPGNQPPFDPNKIASIEDFNKETKRMGVMVTNQLLGGQREAASVIQGITASVPGVENTYLGGKLVIKGIQAALQRAMDLRAFQNEWMARNQGNLAGSDVAFNKAHPAEAYADKVLNEMHLTEADQESAAKVKVPTGYREGVGKYKGRFFTPDPDRPGQYQEWQNE